MSIWKYHASVLKPPTMHVGLWAARWYWCPGAHRYWLEKNPWMLKIHLRHIKLTAGAWKNNTFSTWSYHKQWWNTWTYCVYKCGNFGEHVPMTAVSKNLLCLLSWRYNLVLTTWMWGRHVKPFLGRWTSLLRSPMMRRSSPSKWWGEMLTMDEVAMLLWLHCFLVTAKTRTRPDTFSFTINGKTFKAKVPVRTWWDGAVTSPNRPPLDVEFCFARCASSQMAPSMWA